MERWKTLAGQGSASISCSTPFCVYQAAMRVVTKLDRLARSVTHLGTIITALEAKAVALRILNLGRR